MLTTRLLIVINVLVFTYMALTGRDSPESLLQYGANFGPLTMSGEWWRLFTSVFLHFGLLHIAMNMMALSFLGPVVEMALGGFGLVVVFLLSGLAGSLTSATWNVQALSVGASGAIYGLLGALIALLLRRELVAGDPAAHPLKSALKALALNLVISLIPGVDMAAHVGGLVMGFFLALAMQTYRGPESPLVRRPSFLLVIGLMLITAAYMQTGGSF